MNGGLTRKDQALRRLDIYPDEIHRIPKISDMLKGSIGSLNKVAEVLRFSSHECAAKFLEAYDEIPQGDRGYIPIEAVVIKADINALELLGAALMAIKSIKGNESALIAMTAHPSVVRDTIKYAAGENGSKDRMMLHQAVGFLPTPKGISLNFGAMPSSDKVAPEEEKKEIERPPLGTEEGDEIEDVFPTIMGELQEWTDDRRKMLTDGE